MPAELLGYKCDGEGPKQRRCFRHFLLAKLQHGWYRTPLDKISSKWSQARLSFLSETVESTRARLLSVYMCAQCLMTRSIWKKRRCASGYRLSLGTAQSVDVRFTTNKRKLQPRLGQCRGSSEGTRVAWAPVRHILGGANHSALARRALTLAALHNQSHRSGVYQSLPLPVFLATYSS